MSLDAITSLNPDAAPDTPSPDAPEPAGAQTVNGQRMVPVSAVIEERRERQAARDRAASLERENADLKKVKENWDIVEPYLPLLASHPKIAKTAPPSAPPPPDADPDLLNAARALGFYRDDGTPDTERAKGAKEFFSGLVKGTVEEAVRPVAHTAAQTAAGALRERAYQVTDKDGRPFASKEHIDAVLNQLPPEQQADVNVVNLALVIARGMGVPASAPPEALHTEGAGGRFTGTSSLSPLERRAAQARGLSEADWIKARDARNDSDFLE